MRLVCFDSAEVTRDQGWAIIITQMSNEEYGADIFIPDSNGDFADRFPMFSNTGFFFTVFQDIQKPRASDNIETYASTLFANNPTAVTQLGEGSRVGTLLDLTIAGSGSLKFDSKDPSINYFSDPKNGEVRMPTCVTPFPYQPSSN